VFSEKSGIFIYLVSFGQEKPNLSSPSPNHALNYNNLTYGIKEHTFGNGESKLDYEDFGTWRRKVVNKVICKISGS
jgi:hypothetical protein